MTLFYVAGHALIRKKAQYLVLKRSALNDYMPLKWDIPGGIVESGESVEAAIQREVMEETGLQVMVNHVLYIYSNRDQVPKRQHFQAVYDCVYVEGEVVLNEKEHSDFRWVKYQEIGQLDTIAFLRELIDNYTPDK